jgi:hypothetical protein
MHCSIIYHRILQSARLFRKDSEVNQCSSDTPVARTVLHPCTLAARFWESASPVNELENLTRLAKAVFNDNLPPSTNPIGTLAICIWVLLDSTIQLFVSYPACLDTKTLVSHRGNLVEIVAHNESELTDDETNKEERSSNLDSKDLSVERDQADSRSPIERPPCVKHLHTSTWLDFPTKGPVKGHNRLVFLGQHRGLNTSEGDLGREDNGKDNEQANEATEKELRHVAGTNVGIHCAEVSWIFGIAVKAIEVEHHGGDIQSELLGSGPDSRRTPDLEGRLAVRKPLVPFLGAGVADDNVCPGHVNAGQDGVEEDREKGSCRWGDVVAGAKIHEEAEGKLVDDGEGETAESRPRTRLSAEMLDCSADARGDGLGLDKEDFWLGRSSLLGWLLV